MKKLYITEIDGVDSSGKSILIGYIQKKYNYYYHTSDRGILSNLVFGEKYRNELDGERYDLSYYTDKDHPIIIFFLYDSNIEDLMLRRSITRDTLTSKYTYEQTEEELALYMKWVKYLRDKGVHVVAFDISKMSYYDMAVLFKQTMDRLSENTLKELE